MDLTYLLIIFLLLIYIAFIAFHFFYGHILFIILQNRRTLFYSPFYLYCCSMGVAKIIYITLNMIIPPLNDVVSSLTQAVFTTILQVLWTSCFLHMVLLR